MFAPCPLVGISKQSLFKPFLCLGITLVNKDRFCNTKESVAFVDAWIQSYSRSEAKEILSTTESKQTKLQRFFETQVASALVVHSLMDFIENLSNYQKNKSMYKHLPRAFQFFDSEVEQ